MVRGVLTGLVWGSVVGFGIVTVANQVVDPIELTPANTVVLAPSDPVVDRPEPDAKPAIEPSTTEQITADIEPEMKPSDVEEGAELATDITSDDGVVDTETLADEETAGAESAAANATQADANVSEVPTQTTPAEAASNISEVTADVVALEDDPALDGVAPDAEDTVAKISDAPQITALTPGTDVASESPVFGSLQSAELDTPANAPSLLSPIDTSLPGQATNPVGRPVGGIKDDMTDEIMAQNEAPEDLDNALGSKVGSFTDREDKLISSRLPSVAAASSDAAPVVSAADLPAVIAHSANYSKIGASPSMSVILVDIGEIDPDASLLENLPFPVTFAVDALTPGAAERADLYRASGLEVLALIGLPKGATAQDASVTIEQARSLVPNSIGFLDVPSSSFQTNREVAAQVIASAQSSGHGVVSFSSGLNAMMQESARAKVPAALVFRDFDGRDQNIAAMKRFLDQAAFRAGIDEDIVMLGRASTDTLQGLAEWSLGNRAATVELVPLSLILQEQLAQ
jgi:polysaccharide deacetylase 2 family uncharacterized protein YibQ